MIETDASCNSSFCPELAQPYHLSEGLSEVPVISAQSLQDFTESLLLKGGANEEEARIFSHSLVDANLLGHDSHGVMRLPFYLGRVKEGILKAGEKLQILNETPAAIAGDGCWGFGQTVMHELMNRLIEKAGTLGVSCGTLKRASHIGRLGEYAEMAAAQGMASIICANTHGSAPRVAPVGGKRPRLGTNPICIGMPGGAEGPFVLDFGTSATAEGKVRIKKIAGEQVPPGLILDPDGNPTTDPNMLYGNPPGTILPMGGDQAYKGFGLSFMVEMLCGALSGGQCAFPDPPPPQGNCVFVVVIDPGHLGGQNHLLNEITNLEKYVRSVPLKEGISEIFLPGDPEKKTAATRKTTGISLDKGNWEALTSLAGELGVPVPEVQA
ncbi:MAG TPA: dehydrogenase [Planctomycetaceae bacterium]|nr:dehydrogenase [Planctomycetaceae bacterium]